MPQNLSPLPISIDIWSKLFSWTDVQINLVQMFLKNLSEFLFPHLDSQQVLDTHRVYLARVVRNTPFIHVMVASQQRFPQFPQSMRQGIYAKLDRNLYLYCPGRRANLPVLHLSETELVGACVVRSSLLAVNSQFSDLSTLILPFLEQPCYLAHLTKTRLQRFYDNDAKYGPDRNWLQRPRHPQLDTTREDKFLQDTLLVLSTLRTGPTKQGQTQPCNDTHNRGLEQHIGSKPESSRIGDGTHDLIA